MVDILGMNSEKLIEITFTFYHKLERKSEQFKRLVDKLLIDTNRSLGALVLSTKYLKKGSFSS